MLKRRRDAVDSFPAAPLLVSGQVGLKSADLTLDVYSEVLAHTQDDERRGWQGPGSCAYSPAFLTWITRIHE